MTRPQFDRYFKFHIGEPVLLSGFQGMQDVLGVIIVSRGLVQEGKDHRPVARYSVIAHTQDVQTRAPVITQFYVAEYSLRRDTSRENYALAQ